MSSSASGGNTAASGAAQPSQDPKSATQNPTLEEDDEFEDFPVEDWSPAETELPGANTTSTTTSSGQTAQPAGGEVGTHLWEESWDDDDTNEDFSAQLREELKKVQQNKAS